MSQELRVATTTRQGTNQHARTCTRCKPLSADDQKLIAAGIPEAVVRQLNALPPDQRRDVLEQELRQRRQSIVPPAPSMVEAIRQHRQQPTAAPTVASGRTAPKAPNFLAALGFKKGAK